MLYAGSTKAHLGTAALAADAQQQILSPVSAIRTADCAGRTTDDKVHLGAAALAADAAQQLPALLLDGLDAVHRLHGARVLHCHLGQMR